MEFKGTQGNWKLAENEFGYYTSVRNLDSSRKICVSRVNNQTENNANLLLISKAPEMLKKLSHIYEKKTITFDDLLSIKKLLIETTEL